MYSCSCAPGFTGRDCGTNIDDCPGNSCTAATTASCVDDVEGYTCQCLPGYSGTFCEEEIDECEEYGCLNGGTCEDLVGDFSCVCPDLFTGNACEEPIDGDQCLPMPCVNGGTCVDEVVKLLPSFLLLSLSVTHTLSLFFPFNEHHTYRLYMSTCTCT